MCVMSMVMEHFDDKWRQYFQPPFIPYVQPANPFQSQPTPTIQPVPVRIPTPEEVAEFHKLLDRARRYDRENGEPDCELQEKKDSLQKLADLFGIKISFDETVAK